MGTAERMWSISKRAGLLFCCASLLMSVTIGCGSTQSKRINVGAVYDIRAGRYDTARRKLRRHSLDRESADVILDNLRLAVAAVHDGAFFEAKLALRRAYPYLVAGTVNDKDARNTAFFEYESRLVWKGEPFEQAAAWYYQGLIPMIEGDWENTRAAARNMLFTLVDFANSPSDVLEAMREAESPEWFDDNSESIESDLAIGYLLLGISEFWQGRTGEGGDAEVAFDYALELRPDLAGLIDVLRTGAYNTLLIVEAERGPRKMGHGEYDEYFTFEPRPDGVAEPLTVLVNGDELSADTWAEFPAAVDFLALAQHPRWWSLRSLRETKRGIGEVLKIAGTGALIYGSVSTDDNSKDKAALAGLAALALGEMVAQGSAADLRSFDVLPRSVYLVPLQLAPGPQTVAVSLPNRNRSAVRHFIQPGFKTPAVYALRLMEDEFQTDALQAAETTRQIQRPIVHPNDVTGPIIGTYPYILGGTCVCTPTADVLASYQAGGYLQGWLLDDLLDLYRAERIVFAPLPASSETTKTYHHILRPGGRLLFTPVPGSAGFETSTYGEGLPAYEPKSAELKAARARLLAEGQ